jgi:hypothetical protein
MLANTACFAYAPVASPTPQIGQRVALAITDQGRVAVGDQLGSGVARVEGRLAAVDGDDLLLGVTRVKLVGGTTSLWSGEQVRLRREYIARIEERKFSARRTLIAAGAAAVTVGLIIATASLTGIGLGGDKNRPRDPPPDS